ncbi:MAG: lysostaphin resistance A-like protein [Promethearchaeota archaeon]
MSLNIGENPVLLILLSFLEIFLILIPALIASLIEKTTIKVEIKNMGFQPSQGSRVDFVVKMLLGSVIGEILFLSAGYIMFFYRDIIVKTIFGKDFILIGRNNTINTNPICIEPIQLFFLIILQFVVIGPCEEGFFRGFLIKKCEKKFKRIYSIIFSSICFSFYHMPPFLVPLETIITLFGYYFTLGIILSILFIKTDYSLFSCSIAHSVFNSLIFII